MSTFRNRPSSTENYRNPDHQKYVTGDGWKSGESDTDAPGAKSAKGAGKEGVAGLKAETARPPSHGNTGTQSAPEQKTKLGVSVVCCKGNGGQMGQIKGGDPHGYLGHFRSPKVLKEGHNQGAPIPGAVMPATSGAGDMPLPTMGSGITARPVNPPPPGINTGGATGGAAPVPPRRVGGGAAASNANVKRPGVAPTAKSANPLQRMRKATSDVKMARTKLAGAMKGGAKKRGERVM